MINADAIISTGINPAVNWYHLIMQNKRIVFIGCGNMGGSLIGGLIANGYARSLLTGVEPDDERRLKIATEFNIQTRAEINGAINGAAVIVLAVKPQVLHTALTALRGALDAPPPLIMSIVAGVRAQTIAAGLGDDFPVIRVMPNTPSLIRSGVAALYANEKAAAAQQAFATQIMQAVGAVIWLNDEALLDVVTAISGSGPAYFFLIVELLERIAQGMGLQPDHARILTVETALGAARMLKETGSDPTTLREQVTSPGGTTEQAIKVLHENGLEPLLRDALTACYQRAVELAEQHPIT